MSTSYVMKVSTTGQVSIPAKARSRWMADRVIVVDLGDRIVMRPLPPKSIATLVGKYRGRGPSTTAARKAARVQAAAHEHRKLR